LPGDLLNVQQKTCPEQRSPAIPSFTHRRSYGPDRHREQANGSIQPQHPELPGRDTKATAHADVRMSFYYPVHRDRAKDGGSRAITHRYEILKSCVRIPADNRPSGGDHHGFYQWRL